MNLDLRSVVRTVGSQRRLLAAACAAAAVASGLAHLAPPAEPTSDVVVLAHDVAAGTRLRPDDVRPVAWPDRLRPVGSIGTPDDAVGRVLSTAGRRGEPLTDARLVGPSLLAGATTGDLAVSVRITDPAVADLVAAGSRVDVYATLESAGPDDAIEVATDLLVLAVRDAGDSASEGAVVVLAAPPDIARRLAGAAATARLALGLRPA